MEKCKKEKPEKQQDIKVARRVSHPPPYPPTPHKPHQNVTTNPNPRTENRKN
tara:strand:- start:8124 stop:8279 length:156 start_codon:yes stop_codon:yes gene_type:complete